MIRKQSVALSLLPLCAALLAPVPSGYGVGVSSAAAQSSATVGRGLTREEVGVVMDVISDVLTGGESSGDQAEADKSDKPGKRGKGGLPPGLAKRDSLPPGLARQVRETGSLPPGLQKRLTDDIEARLPGKTARVERDNVVIIDEQTGAVLDVVRDVMDILNRGR